ncbi:MAG: ABC transporter substrate-binding protein [Chloroflexi bacterium]|nr:ABC transporter substrate-binding protein [Chloroflexota bacterium]
MKKIIFTIFALLIALASCNPFMQDSAVAPETSEAPVVNEIPEISDGFTVTDALGREIQFENVPEKIIIAGRQTPMLVNFFYLFETANEKISAIERRSQSADSFLAILDPDIESKYSLERDANVEQIAPFEPDAVVLKTTMRESVGLGLEEVGIPVVYIEFESVDQIYRDLAIFAALLGEQDRGAELIADYQNIKTEIDERVIESTSPLNVVLAQAEDQEGEVIFSVPPAAWLQTAMVQDLGANPLWLEASQGGGWADVNIEQIINWNPDLFFVVNYQGNGPAIVETVSNDPLWQNINAIENNQVFPFGFDFLSWDQPDPRWILGYSWMANKLYPEQVASEETIDIIKNFYVDFYGLTEDEYSEFVAPRIESFFE